MTAYEDESAKDVIFYGKIINPTKYPVLVTIVHPSFSWGFRDKVLDWLNTCYPEVGFVYNVQFGRSSDIRSLVHNFGFSDQDRHVAVALKLKWDS